MNMQKFLLLSLILFFSCTNYTEENKKQESLSKVVSFTVTSKNPQLTSKTGQAVSLSEMITKTVDSGDKILFKNFSFTLDNRVEGSLNFYSDNGKLMCNAPTKLSIMSMPPDGTGITNYNKGDNIEFIGITLIKIDSINFVISDILFNK